MMNVPDKRRAMTFITQIKNDIFKETYRSFENPYTIPDFNEHISMPENRNRYARRRMEVGDDFEWSRR